MIALFIFIGTPFVATPANNYTIEDLEILASTGPYPEFFAHIYDIRPAERDKKWMELAQATSEKYVLHLYANKMIDLENWRKIRELSGQVYNKNNDGLKLARNKYGTALMEFCFKTKSFKECYPLGMEVFGDQSDPQLAHDLGRIIHHHFEQNASETDRMISSVWPFYRIMAAHPLSEFYCDKSYFQDIVLGVLNQNIAELSDDKIADQVFQTMHQDCWKQLANTLKKDLAHNFTNSQNYKLLMATKSIAPKDLLTFKIIYLLQQTQQGPLLEQSFQALLSLKDDYERRRSVLNQLKQIDPLPGKVFAKSDDKTALVIIKNLSQFFPEYVDHYASTCLNYLSGEQQFPNGNPTLECNELFDVAQKIQVVPEMVVKRFKQIRNFKNL